MGAIVCRQCRFAHIGPCNPERDPMDAELELLRDQVTKQPTEIAALRKQLLTKSVNKTANGAQPVNRKVYMREYMKKRREKARAA